MPNYSLNWTARSSDKNVDDKGDKNVDAVAHPPEVNPSEAKDLSASSLPRHDRLNLGEMRVEEGWIWAKAQAQLAFAGLCWSWAHLVQCGPDEPG